jgi:hypothetical protein
MTDRADPGGDLRAENDDSLVEEPSGQLLIDRPGGRGGFGNGSLHGLPAFSFDAGIPASRSTMVRRAAASQENLLIAEEHGGLRRSRCQFLDPSAPAMR